MGQRERASLCPFLRPPVGAPAPGASMRRVVLATVALLLVLPAVDCGGGGPVTILFTGDDRGWLTPAG